MIERRQIQITGIVQSVGFGPLVGALAPGLKFSLTGGFRPTMAAFPSDKPRLPRRR